MTDSCIIDSADAIRNERDFDPGPGKHVLFFGDPMCSWCWGFAPELRSLATKAHGRAEVHIVMGGLRPGTAEPWDASMRSYIRHHWEDVAAKTGQPFDFSQFEHADFIYDTEPACRAVIAARTIASDKTLDMYEAVQHAFYAANTDVTTPANLTACAVGIGLDAGLFEAAFHAADMQVRVAFDFQRTQAFGVQGFPSIVCAEDGQYAFLAMGYRPYNAMQDDFEAWLAA